MTSFCFNWNKINNNPTLGYVVTDLFASVSCFCHKCNYCLCSEGSSVAVISIFLCGVDVGPVGAASLRQLPLYKQVCFQLAVFRVGSPLEPMKDVDAVLLWVYKQAGLEKGGGVLKCAPV